MENNEVPKQRGWSIIRKAQVIGTLAGGLFTIGIFIFCAIMPPEGHQGFPDFSGFLSDLAEYPTVAIICGAFGVSPNWLVNNESGGAAVFPEFMAVIINLAIGFLGGTFIGWPIQKLKTKN